jgi:hypothetical protein
MKKHNFANKAAIYNVSNIYTPVFNSPSHSRIIVCPRNSTAKIVEEINILAYSANK